MYCLSKKEQEKACAELMFAKKLGLIEESGLEALERRREERNRNNRKKLEKGEPVFGVAFFSSPAYFQYELTGFKLDFAEETEEIKKHYRYREIGENEKRRFYDENQELFTRFLGDSFSYEEVELIIRKRIREAEYEENVQKLLCQFPQGERQ